MRIEALLLVPAIRQCAVAAQQNAGKRPLAELLAKAAQNRQT
jgi:hypothetical protein